MITEDGHLKAIDFGTAKVFHVPGKNDVLWGKLKDLREKFDAEDILLLSSEDKSQFVGTAEYVSPELLENMQTGICSDYWALGIILYQMATGTFPFDGITEHLKFEKIRQCEVSFPPEMNPDLRDLISKLLVKNPAKRLGSGPVDGPLGIGELKNHPFFSGTDWENLATTQPPQTNILSPFKKTAGQQFKFQEETKGELKIEPNIVKKESTTGSPMTGLPSSAIQSPMVDNVETLSSSITSDKSRSPPKIAMRGKLLKKSYMLFYRQREVIIYADPPRLLYFEPDTRILKVRLSSLPLAAFI